MSRLDEIKARAEQVHWTSTSIEQAMARMASSAADVPWLVFEVERMTAERDAQIKRAERLERWYADALTMLDKSRRWKSVASLTAERDALAARLALVESLAGQWERLAETAINPDSREWLQACAATLRECLSGWQKMHAALAGSEADTTDTQPTDPGCGCSTNPARARYADGDPAGCYCTCSDDAREGCEHEPDGPQPTDLEVK